MQVRSLGNEACSGRLRGNVVILSVTKGLDLLGVRFDGGPFHIGSGVRMKSFHQSDVIEQKLVAAGCA
jgi:hypothetical protein